MFRFLILAFCGLLTESALLAGVVVKTRGENTPLKPIFSTIDFASQVLPIFKEYCFSCHQKEHVDAQGRAKKPKGKFRLDHPEAVVKGGDSGRAVNPGNAESSNLYLFTTLPEDDDWVMPPKGDLLSKKQQQIIKLWINEGADFGAWRGESE